MKKITTKLSLTLIALCFGLTLFAQSGIKPIEKLVNQKLAEYRGNAQQVDLFSVDPAVAQKSVLITKDLKEKTILSLDAKLNNRLLTLAPEVLQISLPSVNGAFELQLIKQDITTFDFSVVTDKSNGQPIDYTKGLHYRGIVKNQPGSVVAISFFDNEVMGLISTDEGNFNLGLVTGTTDTYVLYNDKKLEGKTAASCGTPDMPAGFVIKDKAVSGEKATVRCVKVYLETDYDLFQNKGSATNVTNYVSGLFNQVAALYQNENIVTQISQLYVWTSNDPYSGSSSGNYLDAFRATRTTFNGDIAHLVNMTGNLGGVAYVDVICNKSYGYAFSCIDPSYNNVPTYSWSVEVFTHEMGHNLGSPHTQSCSWQGGALDNCYTTEGGCPAGPAPTNGGTIMSYCHLTNYGINFNNGFGTQPGNLIRSKVSAASCLGTCETGGPVTCNTPANLAASFISQTSFTIQYNASFNAVNYEVGYKLASASTWTNITTTNTSAVISGLTANTTYNYRVRSNCGNGVYSPYSSTGSVTTQPVAVPYCSSKGNNVSAEWISNVTLGSINNTTAANAGYGNFTSLSTSAAPGATVSFSLTPDFPYGGFLGLFKQTQPEFFRVFVDFNKDGDFTDAGETVYSSTASTTGAISGSFVVPAGTAAGNTRIRVSMKRGAVAASCETFANGEVEDYTLSITAPTSTGILSPEKAVVDLKPNMFPNPTNGLVNLEFTAPAGSGKVDLIVMDLSGKQVAVASWNEQGSDQNISHQIDLSTHPKGIYMVSLSSTSGGRSISRLVIQ